MGRGAWIKEEKGEWGLEWGLGLEMGIGDWGLGLEMGIGARGLE